METTAAAGSLVESNDDLLMEIMVWLPPRSVFRFRCVSKRWNNMVSDRIFLQTYSKLTSRRSKTASHLPMAFLQKTDLIAFPAIPKAPPISILPTHGNLNIIKYLPRKRRLGFLINSSNGLLLFGRYYGTRSRGVDPLRILNPVTKRWIMAPPSRNNIAIRQSSVALMCEDNACGELMANYIVVRIGIRVADAEDKDNNIMAIETYSSKSGEWHESSVVCTESNYLVRNSMKHPFVFNGVIHWFSSRFKILVYDPNDGENHLQFIDIPCPVREDDDDDFAVSMTYGRSADNVLLYGAITTKNLEIWMLPKSGGGYKRSTTIPESEWILLHSIGLDFLFREVEPVMDNSTIFRAAVNKRFKRLCFEAFIPCDPLVSVLSFGTETIIYYHWESKSVELARYYGRPVAYGRSYGYTLCPYWESPILSSYCL